MPYKVLVIGGVALGPKAASRIKRVMPDAEVTLIDAHKLISYGGCGIPYYVSGDVSDHTQLQETLFHMVRDEVFFEACKDVTVLTETKALTINRQEKTVTVQSKDGQKRDLPYDRLVLATGSLPRNLPLPGLDLENVFAVSSLEAGIRIKEKITKGVQSAVVVGGGFIGLEMAEALADMWGIETAVVEVADQVMPGFVSPSMATGLAERLKANGVSVYTGEMVKELQGENGVVTQVQTDKRTLAADLVILAVGVLPNDQLARAAGLACAERGGILVSKTLQTSDPDIYAGGDCIVVDNLVTGRPGFYPLGSLANRQGRIIGSNIAGQRATFDGAVGTFIIKLFDTACSGTGLSLQGARREGFDAVSAVVMQFDHSHFYPEKDMMCLELVVDRKTRRVLGIQGVCANGDSLKNRIDAVAAILKFAPTVDEISTMELAYSPPYGSAMDILNAVANAADNILQGLCDPLPPEVFRALWDKRDEENLLCLDVREWGNAEVYVKKYPKHWLNIPQGQIRDRLQEIPEGKKLVLLCNTGTRAYEAQIMLRQAGYSHIPNVQGGLGFCALLGFDPAKE